jgi:hypothetical protein
MSTQFVQRGAQFLIGNSLLWLAIVFEVFRISVAAAFLTTAASGFCLFGGLLLRRRMSMTGDWIALALTALAAFLLLNTAGQS